MTETRAPRTTASTALLFLDILFRNDAHYRRALTWIARLKASSIDCVLRRTNLVNRVWNGDESRAREERRESRFLLTTVITITRNATFIPDPFGDVPYLIGRRPRGIPSWGLWGTSTFFSPTTRSRYSRKIFHKKYSLATFPTNCMEKQEWEISRSPPLLRMLSFLHKTLNGHWNENIRFLILLIAIIFKVQNYLSLTREWQNKRNFLQLETHYKNYLTTGNKYLSLKCSFRDK